MMRGQRHWAIAVRKPDDSIAVDSFRVNSPTERYPWLKRPILRGMVAMVDSLVLGMKAISYSAQFVGEEEGDELTARDMAIAIIGAVALTIVLFFITPAYLTSLMDKYIDSTVVYNIIEGLIRIGIFVAYILAVSMIKDIGRVFEYHGAEHKTIHAFERGIELSPEQVENFSTRHVRCGTAFLLIVMVVLIIVFAFLGRPAFWLRVLSRIIVIPLVAGISYEVLKYTARHQDSKIVRALVWPGLLLQRLTTREPDRQQLEVAIASLQELLRAEHPAEQTSEA